jgi:histidinol-phosphate/aromatic aminotransferase/cobyric acid decarboxylase-like protein
LAGSRVGMPLKMSETIAALSDFQSSPNDCRSVTSSTATIAVERPKFIDETFLLNKKVEEFTSRIEPIKHSNIASNANFIYFFFRKL